MAEVMMWSGANKMLTTPKGEDAARVQDMPVFNNGRLSVSCWRLTPEELKSIVETGCVFLSVMFGASSPPVFIGSEESVKAVVIDFGGIWKKAEDGSSFKVVE